MKRSSPTLISGGQAIDDRGRLVFNNDFDLADFRRFYTVENHVRGFVRAWHGHKKEAKAVTILAGAAVVGAVEIDDWENPSGSLPVHRFVLTDSQPCVLLIPAGFANGFMTLQEGTKLLFFSSLSVTESLGDDYRFDSRLWNPWEIEER